MGNVVLGTYTLWRASLLVAALGWGMLINLCLWPPVSTLIPREETDEGWKVKWDAFIKVPVPKAVGRTMSSIQGESKH